MESKWTGYGLLSLAFPNYSWADTEGSDSDSEDTDGESEPRMIEYRESSKCPSSSADPSNDENYPSDRSENGSTVSLEEDLIAINRQSREERDGVQAVLRKNVGKCTLFAQLVLHRSIVRHAKWRCFCSDEESFSDACSQEDWISWLIIRFYS